MKTFIVLFTMLLCMNVWAQEKSYDLAALLQQKKVTLVNRNASLSENAKIAGVELSEGDGEGIMWLKGVTFSNGKIQMDLKGRDVLQRSFIGIAFHGTNDSTFDAIYFRPFNFHSTDSVRKIHAVQYVSHPKYPWFKLREEQNGIYEKALINPPGPNGWFHATIVVNDDLVSVFVNDDEIPSLTVKKISTIHTGKIGLWVGNGSNGQFSNLVITNRK